MNTRWIYLVRHGMYGPEGNFDEKLGYGLTPLGIRQARATAKIFRDVGITSIHASSLLRATETASIIAEQLPPVPFRTTSLLWEGIPCLARGVDPASDELWEPGRIKRDGARVERALRKYFTRARGTDKHDLVVAHGNVIRYLICRALDVDPSAWLNLGIHNCGVSLLYVGADGKKGLISHNDIGHLPKKLRTE